MLLEGRVSIVTGCASRRGIGRATAPPFAAGGARVAVADRDGAGTEAAAAAVAAGHGDADVSAATRAVNARIGQPVARGP